MQIATPPAIVTAKGWAPPIPPKPAVSTSFPVNELVFQCFFAAATKVGAILSNVDSKKKEALEFYGRNLGLTFQIADDTLDYNSELKLFGKKIGKDFFENKITLPIILLCQKTSEKEKENIKNIFSKENKDDKNFNYILSLIKKYNIISDCYRKAEHYINLAGNALSAFDENENKKIMQGLTSFSLERDF